MFKVLSSHVCATETQRVNFHLDGRYETGSILCGLRGSDGVAVVETMSEGNRSHQEHKTLHLFLAASQEEVRVNEYN